MRGAGAGCCERTAVFFVASFSSCVTYVMILKALEGRGRVAAATPAARDPRLDHRPVGGVVRARAATQTASIGAQSAVRGGGCVSAHA